MSAATSGGGNELAARSREIVAGALEAARKAGADQADALLFDADSHEVRVRGEEIDFVKQAHERCLGIRTLVRAEGGMQSAVTSTSDLTPDAVERMAGETVALARATAPDPHAGLPEDAPAADWPDLELYCESDRNVAVEARIEDARRAELAAREVDERICNSEGSQASSGFTQIVYGHSEGFLGDYRSASHGLFSEPLAGERGGEGGGLQRDYWMTSARRLDALEDAAAVGRRAAQRALRRLGAKPVSTCEVPVIFDEVTAPSLWRQAAGLVSGYAVYRQSTCWGERLGDTVASELVTLVDDGRLPGGLGSKPFDGEGLPTRRNVVIESGRLASWLLDGYSARKLGLASTGNAARGAGSGPSVGATNLWLEPGDGGTLEEIIAGTERGLLVTELIGMGFNPVTGDYSRGAAGLWIENGEVSHPVEEITIAGQWDAMLAAIDRVGSELTWLGRVASPPVRIAKMTVAGA